jgi:hypothetical protein
MNNYIIFYINNNLNKLEYSQSNEYQFFEYKYNDNNFNNIFSQIFEHKIKVLIYFEDIDKEKLNNIIDILEQHKNFELFNITIFNNIINANLAIPLFFTKSNIKTFKKIINIFPFETAITVCNETTYNLLKYINKSIDVIHDKDKDEEDINKCFITGHRKKKIGGSINPSTSDQKRYVFRMMETNKLNILDQTWWFKYYFSIPPCAYGRLSQSSGTCWCNVILNICFLTPAISTILLQKFKELETEHKKYIKNKYKDFNDICDCDDILKNILYGLINIILINKKKATTLDCNFVSEIAARIKGFALYRDEFYYKTLDEKLLFGDYYFSMIGFSIILYILFIDNIDYVIIISDNIYSKLHFQKSDMLEFIENNLSTIPKLEYDRLNNEIKKIDNMIKFGNNLIENELSNSNKILSIKWSDIIYNLDDFNQKNPPNIIIIPCKIDTISIKEMIYINDIEYKLQSAGIGINSKDFAHIVSGLYCNDKYYVYDSNNIISYCKWSKANLKEYIDLLNDRYNNYNYNIDFDFAVYIKN